MSHDAATINGTAESTRLYHAAGGRRPTAWVIANTMPTKTTAPALNFTATASAVATVATARRPSVGDEMARSRDHSAAVNAKATGRSLYAMPACARTSGSNMTIVAAKSAARAPAAV